MKWKGFNLDWCRTCDTVYYSCEICKNSSCNGGGCDVCMVEWDNFRKSDWCQIETEERFWEEVYKTIQ